MTLENFPYWTSTMGQTDSVGVTRLRNSGDGHNQVDHTCMAASDSSKLECGIISGRNKLSLVSISPCLKQQTLPPCRCTESPYVCHPYHMILDRMKT